MARTRLLKAAVVAASLALVGLWVLLAVEGPAIAGEAGGLPDASVPPVILAVSIFSALAVAAAVAAIRDAPLVLVLCGGIGLVPVGLLTLLLPWPFRLIGLLDGALVAAGVLLLRGSGRDEAD